jgi:hypothetical protein
MNSVQMTIMDLIILKKKLEQKKGGFLVMLEEYMEAEDFYSQ